MEGKRKFKDGLTFKVNMVMEVTGLSRNTIIREITNGKLKARHLRKNCDWLMEGEELNRWWSRLPSNIDEFEEI